MANNESRDEYNIEWSESAEKEQERLNRVLSDAGVASEDLAAFGEEVQSKLAAGVGDAQERILARKDTSRERLRVLWVTRDVSVFSPHSILQERLLALSEHLEELHIVCVGREGATCTSHRVAPGVWLYDVPDARGFFSLWRARTCIEKELAFGEGFRPDLVVGTDFGFAGYLGYQIAHRHNRAFEIHLDGSSPIIVGTKRSWRTRRIGARLVKATAFIQVPSAYAYAVVRNEYPDIPKERIDIFLPFFDVSGWEERYAQRAEEKEKPFKLTLLFPATPSNTRRFTFLLDAISYVLTQYPTVGLLVAGPDSNGQMKKVVQERALEHSVAFREHAGDMLEYMHDSDLLINVGADAQSEEALVQAAYVGLPVLTIASDMAAELFIDGESAFVCPPSDGVCFAARIGEFLNDNQLRAAFEINAKDRVANLFDVDKGAYYMRLADVLTEHVLAYSSAQKT